MSQNSSDSEGLVSVRIADVVSINPGVDKSRFQDDDLVPFVPMPAVEAGTGRIDVAEMRPFSRVKSGFTLFCPGDVLFAKITPCMENGKAAVVPQLEQQIGFGSTEFFVLRPTEGINPKYLYYFVSSSAFRHEAQHYMTGAVGQKRVPKRFMENEKIPLASTPRQNRIVEKIETLFTQLDKGEEALRAVQRQLQVYRQSVLKAAVTGELTGSDVSNWTETTLGDLLEEIRYGTAKKCGYTSGSTPVLRIPNVVRGSIVLDDLKFTDLTDKELEKLSLEAGDVLIVRSNGSEKLVGRGAIVTEKVVGYAYAGYLIRLRVNHERILSNFLHLSLNSPSTRRLIERQAKSTSGVHNLNSGEVKAIPIQVPSISEQASIVTAVDEAIARVVDLEIWCETELARSDSLRQSILKAAFAGQFVPQNPDDESASELLARIKTDRGERSVETRGQARE